MESKKLESIYAWLKDLSKAKEEKEQWNKMVS